MYGGELMDDVGGYGAEWVGARVGEVQVGWVPGWRYHGGGGTIPGLTRTVPSLAGSG